MGEAVLRGVERPARGVGAVGRGRGPFTGCAPGRAPGVRRRGRWEPEEAGIRREPAPPGESPAARADSAAVVALRTPTQAAHTDRTASAGEGAASHGGLVVTGARMHTGKVIKPVVRCQVSA